MGSLEEKGVSTALNSVDETQFLHATTERFGMYVGRML